MSEEGWYKLRTLLDLYAWEDQDSPLRCHNRRGYWLSIVMSFFSVVIILSVMGLSLRDWADGSRGYSIDSFGMVMPTGQTVPVDGLTEIKSAGLRIAMDAHATFGTDADKKIQNASYVKIKFRHTEIQWVKNGTQYVMKKTKTDLGSTKCSLIDEKTGGSIGDNVVCAEKSSKIGGRYTKNNVFNYIKASVQICKSYCGQSGEIACSSCASDAELSTVLQGNIHTNFYIQQTINVINDTQSYMGLPQTFSLAMNLTPKVDAYVRYHEADIRDKFMYGFQDDAFVRKHYVQFLRSDQRYEPFKFTSDHGQLSAFSLRLDSYVANHEDYTPYTLLEVITSLGGLITLTALIFGSIGKGSNMLMNDDDAVHGTVEAYVAAIAWGDVASAATFARQLRQAQVPAMTNCRSRWWKVYERKKRSFNEIRHFRRIMMELVNDPKFSHLDFRQALSGNIDDHDHTGGSAYDTEECQYGQLRASIVETSEPEPTAVRGGGPEQYSVTV